MKQIIRDIELCKLTGETPVGEAKRLLDFFNNIFDKMVFKTHDDYPESIFMCIDNKVFFEQDPKNETLWCTYKEFWSILSKEFRYNYTDIQTITKYLVEEGLKSKVGEPLLLTFNEPLEVEEGLKSKVGEPLDSELLGKIKVKEDLKLKVGTPWRQSTAIGVALRISILNSINI